MNTLEEAKQILRDNWEEGVKCPCCNQLVKLWKKPLIGTAVADLIRLTKLYLQKNESIHISKFTKQRSNFYTLLYWKLIEKGNIVFDLEKRSSGYWRPTPKGILFVNNEIMIPRRAETYNNKLIRLSGEMLNVVQALGKKFNYQELMENFI